MIEILDYNLRKKDILRKYTFCQYERCFRDIGEFTINAVLEDENKYLLDKSQQYYILFNSQDFGMIESVEKDSDSEYEKTITIKGRMANVLFTKRVINGTLNFSGNSAQYINELVTQNLVKESNKERYVNIDIQYNDKQYLFEHSSNINKQITGGYLWDEMQKVLEQDSNGIDFVPVLGIGYDNTGMIVNTNILKWMLNIIAGKDRTKGNSQGYEPILFSQSLSNIERTTYGMSSKGYTNYAYVAGEGEGSERKWIEVAVNKNAGRVNGGKYVNNKKGWNRAELWIDARDLQSEDENGNVISDAEYEQLLIQRANQKAVENNLEESYEATLTEGALVRYKLGKDYNLGDFVTIVDDELGISVNAQVIKVTISEQNGRTIVDITFTYGKIVRDKVQEISNNANKLEEVNNTVKYLESNAKVIANDKVSYGNKKLLWSGTLKKGNTVNLGSNDWNKYVLFGAKTSDGNMMMLGLRCDSGTTAYISFFCGSDNGTITYLYKGNTEISNTNIFKNVSISRHKYVEYQGDSGNAINVDITELWGIM